MFACAILFIGYKAVIRAYLASAIGDFSAFNTHSLTNVAVTTGISCSESDVKSTCSSPGRLSTRGNSQNSEDVQLKAMVASTCITD